MGKLGQYRRSAADAEPPRQGGFADGRTELPVAVVIEISRSTVDGAPTHKCPGTFRFPEVRLSLSLSLPLSPSLSPPLTRASRSAPPAPLTRDPRCRRARARDPR